MKTPRLAVAEMISAARCSSPSSPARATSFRTVAALAAIVSTALILTGCASAPPLARAPRIDFAQSGKGIPVEQLKSGKLSPEQLRAVAEEADAVAVALNPPVGAAPGWSGGGGGGSSISKADIDNFVNNVRPLFENVAQNYVDTAKEAEGRGIAADPAVATNWKFYNQMVSAGAPPNMVTAQCLALTAQLSRETLRLRNEMK